MNSDIYKLTKQKRSIKMKKLAVSLETKHILYLRNEIKKSK